MNSSKQAHAVDRIRMRDKLRRGVEDVGLPRECPKNFTDMEYLYYRQIVDNCDHLEQRHYPLVVAFARSAAISHSATEKLQAALVSGADPLMLRELRMAYKDSSKMVQQYLAQLGIKENAGAVTRVMPSTIIDEFS